MGKVKIKYTIDEKINTGWECPFNTMDDEEYTYCNLSCDKQFCGPEVPEGCPARIKEDDNEKEISS